MANNENMNIKKLSEEGESSYCNCPPSGRGTKSVDIELKTILPEIKSISLRKPFAMIVGSMATQGKSNNDVDLVVRGEDLSDKVKESINFRLYRLFTDILKCPYDEVTKYVHIHYNNAGSYTSYVPLYELNLVPVHSFETIQMSKVPFALRGNINIVNKSDGPRIIAGYANVAIVDSEEQFIPIETLKKGIQSLLGDPYYANLMLVHQNIQIGKIIEKFQSFTTHVDDKGLFIVAEIRQDLKTANEVWKCILNNEINGFSIGCEVLNFHKKCDESKCITILDEINIFEVSVCTHPVNEESGFIVVSKSKKEYVCNDCDIKLDEKMTKDETTKAKEIKPVEQPKEVKKDEPELPKVDKIAELERKITALEEALQQAKAPKEEPKEEEPEDVPGMPVPEDMALFMLDYIINNPKSSAQDIAKAWIESKKLPPKKEEPVPPKEDKPVEEPPKETPKPEEGKYPEPSKYPYPEKMSEVVDKLSAIVDKLTKFSAEEEIKLSIKARDDQISALNEKIKILGESKGESKTLQNTEEVKELEHDHSFIVKRGEVYLKE